MTVKELIEELQKLNEAAIVVRDTDWAGQQEIQTVTVERADWPQEEKVVVLW